MAKANLTDPLPFFFHAASERLLYLAAGPRPFVFTITLADVLAPDPAGPVVGPTTHPFGRSTGVSSLAEDGTRRGLAETTAVTLGALESVCDFCHVVTPMALESLLALWGDFCDAVAERLNAGDDLSTALTTTWTSEATAA